VKVDKINFLFSMIMGSMMGYVSPIFIMAYTYAGASQFQEITITAKEFYLNWFILGIVIFVVVTMYFYSSLNKNY
jgi:predicted branched-subunit amino acid permease